MRARDVERHATLGEILLCARVCVQTIYEHRASDVEEASFCRTGSDEIPAATVALWRCGIDSVANSLRPPATGEPLAGFAERAALQAHDKVDDVAVLRTRKAVEVRIVGITH